MSAKEIACCEACGVAMDVSAVEPFSRVECPSCSEHTRVKCEFGPYTLSRRHAVGGMSLVFVALDNTLGREVIVKILNQDYSSDEKRIRAFEEEARITALISHPNVVRVFTTGRAFGRFYIAMEFVTGGHFEHHIRERGTIPELEALPLALDVVSGLKAAKASGLIHRDVKPGNILLDDQGGAKLVDFGLALVTQGGKARAAEIWATPYYVPPETIEGAEEDFRSDIYAFGSTMYHALAGKPPCDEESMNTDRLRKAKQEIPPLHRVAPWLSSETCEVIGRCMAHRPDDRYDSYDELIAALKAASQRVGSGTAQPAPSSDLASRRARRRGGAALGPKIATAMAILVVVGAVIFSAQMIWDSSLSGDEESMGDADGSGSVVANVGGRRSDQGQAQGSSSSVEVGQIFAKATAAVSAGDYEEACEQFGRVRDHEGVLEPSGSWAALQAVVCAYAKGDSDLARHEISQAVRHVKRAKSIRTGVRKRLLSLLEQAEGYPPIEFSSNEVERSNEGVLIALLCGLKNWDQGMLLMARPCFEWIERQEITPAREWLIPYVELSRKYSQDFERLRQAEPKTFELGPEESRQHIDELHAVHALLETKGRAKFQVRCWQLELERQARQAPEPLKDHDAGNPRRPRQALEESLARRDFADSVEVLKNWAPSGEVGKKRRLAYMQLVQAAQSFLAELGESVAQGETEVVIETRDGRTFQRIEGGSVEGLLIEENEAEAIFVPWSRIKADSVIGLHRAVSKGQGLEMELMRRHEQAVAFDYLVGNRERALEAAERLAAVSETFGRRWQVVSVAVQD
ncbi:MAG: serine/threonine protein kinase [Verrucomicrobiales bacterium]